MIATEISFGGSCTKFRVVSRGVGPTSFFVLKQVFALFFKYVSFSFLFIFVLSEIVVK